MPTNQPTVSLERRAKLLDAIMRHFVTSHPDIGQLLMALRPDEYGDGLMTVLDPAQATHDSLQTPLIALDGEISLEEFRALCVPFIGEALDSLLDVEVEVRWRPRHNQE